MWEYNYTIDNYELYHHGIKGQKWGIRRFQNKDGGLTPEGRKRYGAGDFKEAKKKVDSANEVVKGAKKVRSEVSKKQSDAKIKSDLSKMSDKDLQQIVNRLNMEERYTQVMQSRNVNAGKSKVDKILDYGGTALGVASSALSIAIAIKELQK